MDNRFVKIMGVIFLGLIVIVFWPSLRDKMGSSKPIKSSPASMDLSAFTKDTVNKITISKGNEQKVLELKNGKWMIGSDEADDDKVNQFFADFAVLAVRDMVSENEENQEKFEVTKDTGYAVTVSANGTDSVFFVGKAGQSANAFYMRKEGIKNVYLVLGSLRDKIVWTADEWKKKQQEVNTDAGAQTQRTSVPAAKGVIKAAPKK